MATPSAPLWVIIATLPGRGQTGENVALRPTAGSVLMMPMQLGPIIRTPAARIRSTSAASRSRPFAPVSLKPAVITTTPLTPLARQSSTTPSTAALGTTITTRSTGPGIADTDR